MDEILSLLADRQPEGVAVDCEIERVDSLSVKARLHYHTKGGWVVSKVYGIRMMPRGLIIGLLHLDIRPERS